MDRKWHKFCGENSCSRKISQQPGTTPNGFTFHLTRSQLKQLISDVERYLRQTPRRLSCRQHAVDSLAGGSSISPQRFSGSKTGDRTDDLDRAIVCCHLGKPESQRAQRDRIDPQSRPCR